MALISALHGLDGCGRWRFDPVDTTGDAVASDSDTRAISFVQSNAGDVGSGSSLTVPFVGSVRLGSLLVLGLTFDTATSATAMQVTDTLGNFYRLIGPYDFSSNRQYIAYAITTVPGPDSVTVTVSAPVITYLQLYLHEYESSWATDPVDVAASGTGTSQATDGVQTAPLTTTASKELIFGFATFAGVGIPGTGFMERSNLLGDVTEDEIAPTAGTYRATATMMNGTEWSIVGVAFRTR